MPDIVHDSRLQHVRDNTYSIGSDRSNPIHVSGPNIEGTLQFPNMGFHFSDRETSNSKGLLIHFIEINSFFCKPPMNQDRTLPMPENMELSVKKKM